ncbi:hypothetical protein B0H13DRAFT_1929047 [Mycena leptocephala]|nr:hypothetical protein B0H13DRAFT_1929047 [Mycena leptocephala]
MLASPLVATVAGIREIRIFEVCLDVTAKVTPFSKTKVRILRSQVTAREKTGAGTGLLTGYYRVEITKIFTGFTRSLRLFCPSSTKLSGEPPTGPPGPRPVTGRPASGLPSTGPPIRHGIMFAIKHETYADPSDQPGHMLLSMTPPGLEVALTQTGEQNSVFGVIKLL